MLRLLCACRYGEMAAHALSKALAAAVSLYTACVLPACALEVAAFVYKDVESRRRERYNPEYENDIVRRFLAPPPRLVSRPQRAAITLHLSCRAVSFGPSSMPCGSPCTSQQRASC